MKDQSGSRLQRVIKSIPRRLFDETKVEFNLLLQQHDLTDDSPPTRTPSKEMEIPQKQFLK